MRLLSFLSTPDRTRTCYPQLRRLLLYPDELRAQKEHLDVKTSLTKLREFAERNKFFPRSFGLVKKNSWTTTAQPVYLKSVPILTDL